jgi:hypothetical protein
MSKQGSQGLIGACDVNYWAAFFIFQINICTFFQQKLDCSRVLTVAL